jgi:mRNA-degrading endonuclease RelE of RelBE toxin-antitoxin system
MASYNILLKPSVERDLRSLPKAVIARAMRQIESLEDEPVPRQSVKWVGAEQLYRIREGILYSSLFKNSPWVRTSPI